MEVSILSTIFATTSALFGLGKGIGDTLIIFYQSMIEVVAILCYRLCHYTMLYFFWQKNKRIEMIEGGNAGNDEDAFGLQQRYP